MGGLLGISLGLLGRTLGLLAQERLPGELMQQEKQAVKEELE